MQFVHSLENRVLMSVTADTLTADNAAVASQLTVTRAALGSLRAADTGFRNTLVHDIRLSNTKATRAANNRMIAILQRDSALDFTRITAAENTLLALAKTDSTLGAADGKRLLLHPSKAAYQKTVTRDIARLDTLAAQLTKLENAVLNAATLINPVYTNIITENPSLALFVQTSLNSEGTQDTVFSDAAVQVVMDTNQLAYDLTFPVAPTATLTGATLFRGDATGANQYTQGSAIAHGGWTTGLDVQNVPGNYGAELFLSKVQNPTAADFLTPGALSASLVSGVNTFYFFADGDDTLGGNATFGLNLFLNGAGANSPTISAYTIPGAGQTLNADSSASTAGATFTVVPGAGTLSTSAGANGTVTLSSFQVLGVSGVNSTVDLVNSTNTAPFTPPAHADGIPDTYGVFTITVTP